MAVAPKGTKRACPAIRPCASLRVRSLHRRSEGRRTRGVHAPLRLSPHPCGSPLYATIPLTLLKGRLALPESEREGCSARSVEAISPRSAKKKLPSNSEPESPSGGRVEVLRRGTRGRTPSEERRDRDVPSSRPPERHRKEGTPPQAGPDVGVPFSLVTFSWARKRKLLAVMAKRDDSFSASA